MNSEPTISDVLSAVGGVMEAIGEFSNKVDGRFERLEGQMDNMNGRLTRVESQMVTKAYLDDKLIDLKADLTIVMRKEDHKLEALTRLLAAKKVITKDDAEGILSLEPFPQRV